jgi:hypothetical protein
MAQITADDEIALGMRVQPPFTPAKQLFNLVIADPVMFVVVEHRNENVDMSQEIGETPICS